MENHGFNNIYKDKKVFITGHTGFKGSWLSTWLLTMGAHVVGLSNNIPTSPSLFELLQLEKEITHYLEDVRNQNAVKEIINREKPDYIFHLAAQPIVSLSYEDPVDTFSTNIMGVVNVLDALREADFNCSVVVITSDKCYDNVEWVWGYKETDKLGGKDVYSASKGAAELIVKSYYYSFFKESENIRLVSVRAGNIIGGGDWAKDRIVPDIVTAWSENKKPFIRSPYATRPWQHVLDPLSGYLWIGSKLSQDKNYNGESYNFGPNQDGNITVVTLIEDLAKIWGFDKVKESYTVNRIKKFSEASLLRLNCDKALFNLKWFSTLNYLETIQFTGSWYAQFYQSGESIGEYTKNQIREYSKLAVEKKIIWATP